MTEQRRILIADDEETFLHATVELLRREGYSCDGANDAARALQCETYDLVIADINMPGNVDLEFVHLLSERTPGLPVILVTGHPTLPSAIQSIRLPVVAYLLKPFGFADLLGYARNGLAQSYAYKMVDSMDKQVQAWSQDLQRLKSLPLQKAATPTALAGELYLTLSLQHVAQCLENLQTSVSTLVKSGVASLSRYEAPQNTAFTANVVSEPENDALTPQFAKSPSLANSHVEESDQIHAFCLAVQKEYDLSAREREILSRLLRHQRVSTIAKSLFLSPHTVRNHLKAVFRKVGVHSQSELLEQLTKYAAKAASLFTLFGQING